MKNVDVAVIGGYFGSPKGDQKGDGSQFLPWTKVTKKGDGSEFLLRETKEVSPK